MSGSETVRGVHVCVCALPGPFTVKRFHSVSKPQPAGERRTSRHCVVSLPCCRGRLNPIPGTYTFSVRGRVSAGLSNTMNHFDYDAAPASAPPPDADSTEAAERRLQQVLEHSVSIDSLPNYIGHPPQNVEREIVGFPALPAWKSRALATLLGERYMSNDSHRIAAPKESFGVQTEEVPIRDIGVGVTDDDFVAERRHVLQLNLCLPKDMPQMSVTQLLQAQRRLEDLLDRLTTEINRAKEQEDAANAKRLEEERAASTQFVPTDTWQQRMTEKIKERLERRYTVAAAASGVVRNAQALGAAAPYAANNALGEVARSYGAPDGVYMTEFDRRFRQQAEKLDAIAASPSRKSRSSTSPPRASPSPAATTQHGASAGRKKR
mgnify:CR=1 FL=1